MESELEAKRGETEWLQRQLVQQSAQYQELRVRLVNYEQLDGESLVNMLKSDADRLGQERLATVYKCSRNEVKFCPQKYFVGDK